MRFAIFIIAAGFMGCTSTPKSFERLSEGYRHKATNVVFPNTIPNWKIAEDEPTENINPQIDLAVLYANTSSSKEFKPYATVYVVNGENALASIQQRASNLMPDAKRIKNKAAKLNDGQANFEVYKFKNPSEQKEGLVSVKKPVNVESWFIQPKNDPHLVFWVTIDADSKEEKDLPSKFADAFLAASKAKK